MNSDAHKNTFAHPIYLASRYKLMFSIHNFSQNFSIGNHFTANIKLNQIIFASLLLFYEINAYFYKMLIAIKCLFI